MWEQILPGLRIKIFMTVLLGVIYPLAMTGISQVIFPKQANGSLIKAGDKVLIHSATGGVSQAAIAIARASGVEFADIYATAGSAQRRELLHDMGIEHVYDSRSVEFADQIRRDTDGYGVDIVLNSLTGAAQSAGRKHTTSNTHLVGNINDLQSE